MTDDNRTERPDNDPPRRERADLEELRDWETVQRNAGTDLPIVDDATERIAIPGGFLYRTSGPFGVALVFVPVDK